MLLINQILLCYSSTTVTLNVELDQLTEDVVDRGTKTTSVEIRRVVLTPPRQPQKPGDQGGVLDIQLGVSYF